MTRSICSSAASSTEANTRVAGVVDDDVDRAERVERRVDDAAGGGAVGHVELLDPEPVARGGAEIVERLRSPQGCGHAVALREQLLGEEPAEAGGRAGDEPSLCHACHPSKLADSAILPIR